MIADGKRTGAVSEGVGIAHYMLDPNAKNDPDGKQYSPGERVLQIHTEYAFPILKGSSPKEAAKRFMNQVSSWNKAYRANKNMPKNTWEHMVISFHPNDSEKVSADEAISIAQDALKKIAPGKRPTLFVVHGDTNHLHVHMLYSTVNDQGKIHNLHRDYRGWERQMERLEIEHKLHRVEKRTAIALDESDLNRMPDGTNPSSREYRMSQRTGKLSCKQKIRSLIHECIAICKTEPQEERFGRFIQELHKRKIGISGNIQSTGRVAGVRFYYGIFEKNGIKASALGKDYSWPKLSVRVGFDNEEKGHVNLLKAADYRVEQWAKSDQTRQWAARVGTALNKQGDSVTPGVLSPSQDEIPDFLPNFLKTYLRNLARAAMKEHQQTMARMKESETSFQKVIQAVLDCRRRVIQYQVEQKRLTMGFKS